MPTTRSNRKSTKKVTFEQQQQQQQPEVQVPAPLTGHVATVTDAPSTPASIVELPSVTLAELTDPSSEHYSSRLVFMQERAQKIRAHDISSQDLIHTVPSSAPCGFSQEPTQLMEESEMKDDEAEGKVDSFIETVLLPDGTIGTVGHTVLRGKFAPLETAEMENAQPMMLGMEEEKEGKSENKNDDCKTPETVAPASPTYSPFIEPIAMPSSPLSIDTTAAVTEILPLPPSPKHQRRPRALPQNPNPIVVRDDGIIAGNAYCRPCSNFKSVVDFIFNNELFKTCNDCRVKQQKKGEPEDSKTDDDTKPTADRCPSCSQVIRVSQRRKKDRPAKPVAEEPRFRLLSSDDLRSCTGIVASLQPRQSRSTPAPAASDSAEKKATKVKSEKKRGRKRKEHPVLDEEQRKKAKEDMSLKRKERRIKQQAAKKTFKKLEEREGGLSNEARQLLSATATYYRNFAKVNRSLRKLDPELKEDVESQIDDEGRALAGRFRIATQNVLLVKSVGDEARCENGMREIELRAFTTALNFIRKLTTVKLDWEKAKPLYTEFNEACKGFLNFDAEKNESGVKLDIPDEIGEQTDTEDDESDSDSDDEDEDEEDEEEEEEEERKVEADRK